MIPSKKKNVDKAIEKLKADIGAGGYLIGYFSPTPDGQSVNGRFHIKVNGDAKAAAAILCEFAKNNPAFDVVLNYVEGMRQMNRAAQKRALGDPIEPKSKLILPKMGVIK